LEDLNSDGDNIKIDLKKNIWKGVDWVAVAQGTFWFRELGSIY
jgi:hypothetical protein